MFLVLIFVEGDVASRTESQGQAWPSAIDHILITKRAAKLVILFDYIGKETTTFLNISCTCQE